MNPRQQSLQASQLASYFQHIVPVSIDGVAELKQKIKNLDSNYSSYQSSYDHLKPVFNFHLEGQEFLPTIATDRLGDFVATDRSSALG